MSRVEKILDKELPHDDQAERATLGGIMLDRHLAGDAIKLLPVEAFWRDEHKAIYSAMLSLNEQHQPIDVVTLVSELRTLGKLADVGGAWYISELYNATPTAQNLGSHSRIVYELYVKRSLALASLETIQRALDDSTDAFAELDTARTRVDRLLEGPHRLLNHTDGVFNRAQVLTEVYEYIFDDTLKLVIPTGLKKLDKFIGGLRPEELIVIAGRPGSGKTALATSIGMNISGLGNDAISAPVKCALFSLEMSKQQIWNRIIGALTGIKISRFDDPGNLWAANERQAIISAFTQVERSGLYIDTMPRYSVPLLRARAMRLVETFGVGCIIIDQANKILIPRGHSRNDEVEYLYTEVKTLAKETGVPWVMLNQLNRECEKSHPFRPGLHNLRDSGSVEQEADIVLMCYRAEYYKLDKFENGDLALNRGDIQVEKNRNGETGVARFAYVKHLTQWQNL